MKKEMEFRHRILMDKKEILDKAKATLKTEFIGIDSVIDEVFELLSTWYYFPEMLEKPTIINLWGLTGVGKTALVKRICQLIDYEQYYYHFEPSSITSSDYENALSNLCENGKKNALVIAIDEIQNIRTIDRLGEEKVRHTRLWSLIDTGIIQEKYKTRDSWDFINQLETCIKHGVMVRNGRIVENQDFYDFVMNQKSNSIESDFFIKTQQCREISIISPTSYKGQDLDLRKQFDNLNGNETVKLLRDLKHKNTNPSIIDFSQSLIFILGNIDEAYTMHKNINPDISADEFHEQSLSVTSHTIKQALQDRFRNEQIARLGNNHVVYPAFNTNTFYGIIDLELTKISKSFYQSEEIKITFDNKTREYIYKEGVYPTQGARPVFTTINKIVTSKLSQIVTEMVMKNIIVESIHFKCHKDFVLIEYYNYRQEQVHSIKIAHQLQLERLRKCSHDDIQAITAVHEAGHAVTACILLKTIPEIVKSTSVDQNQGGFVYTKSKLKYIPKKDILPRLAVMLAGYVAEKLIFGEENLTIGSKNDIQDATRFVTKMLKVYGMGDLPVDYNAKDFTTNFEIHDIDNEMNTLAKEYISKAMDLAKESIEQEKTFLLHIANHLKDNRQLIKEEIYKLFKQHSVAFDIGSIIENGDDLFYRKQLTNEIEAMQKRKEIALNNNLQIIN